MTLALVTGANRGLGLEVSRQLLAHGYDVVITARKHASLAQAFASLKASVGFGEAAQRIHTLQLDVSDAASIAALPQALSELGTLDTLVNNAGVSLDGLNADTARQTLETNYLGAVRVYDALRPYLSPHANVVMVSSGMGELSSFSPKLQQTLGSESLTRELINALAAQFVAAVAEERTQLDGFPRNAYSVSKALMNAFTRVEARALVGSPGMRLNAVCPGWVKTAMGGSTAPRGVDHGAKGIVWAATLPPGGPSGGFFRDGKPIPW